MNRTYHRNWALAAIAFLALAPAHSYAQSVPTLELGKRTGRTPFSFGNVGNVVEMRDGRVVANDWGEHAFRIVDFAKNTMPMLGEPGDDPLNYRMAGPVMPWHGDSLLLYAPDQSKPRFLHLTPDGVIVASTPVTSPVPEQSPPHGGYGMTGPFAVDSSGAAYFLVELMDSTLTSYELADMIRVSADGKKRQVVDYLRERRANQARTERPKGLTLSTFHFRDAWALRSDGLAARVVADTFEVVWSRNGKQTGRTGPLPFTPIPITEAEITAYRDSMIDRVNPKPAPDGSGNRPGSGGGGGRATFGGGGSAPTTGDNTPRSFTPPPATTTLRIPNFEPFPDRKPAIPDPRSQKVAMFDPLGQLWVLKERAHGDNIPHVDIIAEGRGLVGHVNLPKNSKLVGFGPKNVYLVSHDDNGDWLERYPFPGS